MAAWRPTLQEPYLLAIRLDHDIDLNSVLKTPAQSPHRRSETTEGGDEGNRTPDIYLAKANRALG